MARIFARYVDREQNKKMTRNAMSSTKEEKEDYKVVIPKEKIPSGWMRLLT